uniref:Uncharacterized protein n=1 Tax=Arundo donax TaxID=35708 RepID=A0A0A9FHA9_ARUDO
MKSESLDVLKWHLNGPYLIEALNFNHFSSAICLLNVGGWANCIQYISLHACGHENFCSC